MDFEQIFNSKELARGLFFPRKTDKPPKMDKIVPFELDIGGSVVIGGIMYSNSPSLPTLLMFHGNAETAGSYEYFMDYFFECSVNYAVVDYRGYGFSSGNSTFRTAIEDSLPTYNKFVDWLDAHGYNTNIVAVGRSLGSVAAAEIGCHNPDSLIGIIFSSGFADTFSLLDRLTEIDLPPPNEEQIRKWSNLPKIADFNVPTLVLHGPRDRIVPYEQGKLIYETLPNHIEKRFVTINGANHNNTMHHREQFYPAIKDFVESCVQNQK